jgi:hypothetical protein
MKDKFEDFISLLIEKTTAGTAPWEKVEDGLHKLVFNSHYILLNFNITLLKKPDFHIKFEVYSNDGKLTLQLIQSAPDRFQTVPDRYYNRLHALCRAVRGEYESLDDTVDALMKDIPF